MPFRQLNKEASKHCNLSMVLKLGYFWIQIIVMVCKQMGMFYVVATLWHYSPSAQRWSLADLSAHRQSILGLSAQQW